MSNTPPKKKDYIRYRPIKKGGFGRWVDVSAGLFQQCCDCGLVHEMQFRVDEDVRSEEGKPMIESRWKRVDY